MTRKTAVKIARITLGVLIAALIALVLSAIFGHLHWMVALVGFLGAAAVIVVVLASLRQYKEPDGGDYE